MIPFEPSDRNHCWKVRGSACSHYSQDDPMLTEAATIRIDMPAASTVQGIAMILAPSHESKRGLSSSIVRPGCRRSADGCWLIDGVVEGYKWLRRRTIRESLQS